MYGNVLAKPGRRCQVAQLNGTAPSSKDRTIEDAVMDIVRALNSKPSCKMNAHELASLKEKASHLASLVGGKQSTKEREGTKK